VTGDFTLSYHYLGSNDRRNHLELFLDIDGKSALETWRAFADYESTEDKHRFFAAPPHRRIYLTYSGAISRNRGRLRILRHGKFVDARLKYCEKETQMRSIWVSFSSN